jgi:hypothetical protein
MRFDEERLKEPFIRFDLALKWRSSPTAQV